jgi:hypothetical protein
MQEPCTYRTSGCDVCLDVDKKSLNFLEKVQLRFLRRILGVGSRSLRVALFSETGILPIKYRRVYLALKNLAYLLELDHKRPVWNALLESLALARTNQISSHLEARIPLELHPLELLLGQLVLDVGLVGRLVRERANGSIMTFAPVSREVIRPR